MSLFWLGKGFTYAWKEAQGEVWQVYQKQVDCFHMATRKFGEKIWISGTENSSEFLFYFWVLAASRNNCQLLFNWVVHHSFCRCLYTGNVFKYVPVHLIQTQGIVTFLFLTPWQVPDIFSWLSIIVLLSFSSRRICSIDWLIVLITLIHHNPANLSDQGWEWETTTKGKRKKTHHSWQLECPKGFSLRFIFF